MSCVRARGAYVRSDPGENLSLGTFPFPFSPWEVFPFPSALQGPIQLQLALSVEFFRYTIGHSLFDVVTLLLPLSLKAAIKFKDFNISISENRGILLKNHSLFEMGTNKPVTLIPLSNPNLVDILGETDFHFESSYFWNLLIPDSQIFKPLDSKVGGFLDFQISKLKAFSQR